MSDIDKKEESWIRKIPTIIVVMAVLIFVIIVIRDHNQYIKWEEDQTDLAAKFQQTSEELALLREANGTLDDVTKKVKSLDQQVADMTVALEKLVEEKNTTDATLSKLRQELSDLKGQIFASENRIAELIKEHETMKTTNQSLRDDIVNKKSVLEATLFLQRQKPVLEQKIQDMKTRYDLAVKAELELQAKLEDLQKRIKQGEAVIRAQKERQTALNSKVSELTEAAKKLSLQNEKLEMWDDHQKKIEYIEYLQQQKNSLEMSINNLLEKGQKLEEENSEPQQAPAR